MQEENLPEDENTIALLQLLALSEQDIEQGKVYPLDEFLAGIEK